MTAIRAAALLALAAIAAVAAPPAWAHNPSVAHVHIGADGADPNRLSVELDLALKDVALTLPLDADRDESVTWGELTALRPALEAYVAANFALAAGGQPCALHPAGLATRRYDDGVYATVRMTADCPAPGGLAVRYSLFFDRDPQHRAVVTYADGSGTTTGLARADGAALRLGGGDDHAFLAFLREGVHHILIGYDHIAFLISLVLPALLVWSGGRWQADPNVRARLLQVFWLVTAFTLAHSVTLTLAALDWVRPSSHWVEALIAFSVMLAALNNLRPLVTRRLWLLSFGFGLIHGFGFAGALGEIGLPADSRLLALLGFNLGVELGQLAILAVLLPVLHVLRRRGWYARWLLPALSLAIAVLAGGWLLQRLSG